MADKMRSINTKFWNDTFIEDLTVSEKLLFLYLLTNSLTNLLGIYEISIRRISYETGLNKETILKGFERFATVKKVYYVDNYIIMPNFLKNQNLNANMKKGVVNLYEELPNHLKDSIKGNGSKGFESIRNALGKYEIEIEKEIEKESEEEKEKIDIPTFEEFKNYALDKKPDIDISALNLKYEAWKENNWKTGKNVKIKNWKSTLLNTLPYIDSVKKSTSNELYPGYKDESDFSEYM
jgi:hypothetical protein